MVAEGRERLRQWANADNVQDLGARVAAHEVIRELETLERKLEAAVCATCGNETWNPGEGWLMRRNGIVSVCRSAFHPATERNLPARGIVNEEEAKLPAMNDPMDLLTDKERGLFVTDPWLGTLLLCVNKWRREDKVKNAQSGFQDVKE